MLSNITKQSWKGILLWSNQFYGICALLLATESTLIITHEYPTITILLFIHLTTILFYTYSYEKEHKEGIYNERTKWHQHNKAYLQIRQLALFLACLYLGFFKLNIITKFLNAPFQLQCAVLISVILSLFYYLPINSNGKRILFRDIGIFKSLCIAIVWAVMCCLIPLWLSGFEMDGSKILSNKLWIHFLQLFIYILILAILFDIKDINRDKEELVKTIVVNYGIQNTIHKIIYPLMLLYSCMIFWESRVLHFHFMYWIVQVCIICVTYFFTKGVLTQKSIHINILMIDGLMIIKAILSIIAFQAFVH